jgi:hypothetical protein
MTALPHNDAYHGHVKRHLVRANTSTVTLNWGLIAALVLNFAMWAFVAKILTGL